MAVISHAGGYIYASDGSGVVEQLFHDWSFNQHLHQRIVLSGTWEYLVNLACMTQTNIKHANRTSRRIRRWTAAHNKSPPGVLAGDPLASAPYSACLWIPFGA
jgi:hypothetical protein